MITGRVASIWRYPVKSMAGESLRSSSIGKLGIPGDRGWALRDEAAGEIRNGRKLPELLLCSASYLSEPGEDEVPPVEILLPDGSRVRSAVLSDRERRACASP